MSARLLPTEPFTADDPAVVAGAPGYDRKPAVPVSGASGVSDEEFMRAFEACDPALRFTHEQHLRAGFWYLQREPLGHAAERFKAALLRLAGSRSMPDLFHETITWAYMVLLNEKRCELGAGATFDDIKARWPELLDHRDGALRRLYTRDELESAEARRVFCLPRQSAQPAAIP